MLRLSRKGLDTNNEGFPWLPLLILEGISKSREMIILVQRADEIASLNPKVAYYCRVYAIQQVSELSKPKCTPILSIRDLQRIAYPS